MSGELAEEIRKCKPKTLEDWEKYYFTKVRSKEHLVMLGQKLYEKISSIAKKEIESITVDDCVNYVIDVVIKRTLKGSKEK